MATRKTKSKASKEHPHRVTAQDVVLAYLSADRDTAGLTKLHAAPRTLRKAQALLNALGEDTAHFTLYVDEVAPRSNGKGRAAVQLGERRTYTVQEVAPGGPFLRIPVTVVGASKGDQMVVSFMAKRITIEVPTA
jgi:hypothetical protein